MRAILACLDSVNLFKQASKPLHTFDLLLRGKKLKLILDSLGRAIASLEKAIVRAEMNLSDDELRDAVIQRFEYTYELCWKMLKRQLEMDSPGSAQIDSLSFKDLIREGAEKGLIPKVEPWFSYREARNITSHTYEEKQAKLVYTVALKFLPDAKQLLATLQQRN
jgi:nucleotidyltransferase substrate binding protein (TIGR01987 family)